MRVELCIPRGGKMSEKGKEPLSEAERFLGKIDEIKSTFTKIQSQLKEQSVEVSAGAGLVKVVANGVQEIVEIHIDPDLIKMKDKELLEDLIKAAVNEAKKKALEVSQEVFKNTLGFDFQGFKELFST